MAKPHARATDSGKAPCKGATSCGQGPLQGGDWTLQGQPAGVAVASPQRVALVAKAVASKGSGAGGQVQSSPT
ncbi:hypothetical protein GW17_00005991 [Ensete ventricosum]|uniref:Uncharacterized protein n=1 Tax=Ensete ventricosum TaxID=4639 RepID=A0A444G3N6_ENSVE|nr:hypothetical protein GW17_00005991 [Ensete ventricosum]RZR75572.1 hypothetical protein BHM03_00062567 [Ensete ventricosum]